MSEQVQLGKFVSGVVFVLIGLLLYLWSNGNVGNAPYYIRIMPAYLVAIMVFLVVMGAVNILMAFTTKAQTTGPAYDPAEIKICPKCAENIKYEAKVCKHCGFEYSDEELRKEEEDRKRLLQDDEYALKKLSEDSLLRIAYDYQYNKDNYEKAKYYLKRFQKEYPTSEYSNIVKGRLGEMENG